VKEAIDWKKILPHEFAAIWRNKMKPYSSLENLSNRLKRWIKHNKNRNPFNLISHLGVNHSLRYRLKSQQILR
jgi:hypothetical protein